MPKPSLHIIDTLRSRGVAPHSANRFASSAKALALSLTALLLLAAWPQASAQTTSAWNGGTTDWGTAGNWGSGLTSNTTSALFNSTFSNQPTLTSNQTAQGLWLATGVGQDVTINSASAQTLTITGTPTLNSQTNAGIYMNDSGNRSLTIGPNTSLLILNNTGFYNQEATGVLTISGGLNLNTKTLTIGNGTTSTGNVAISGNISGAGLASLITINSTGTVTLSGNNSYVGPTNLTSNSTLVVGSNTALGVGTFNAGTTGTNTFQASTDVVLANLVGLGNGNTTFSGSNNITFSGNSSTQGFIGGGDKSIINNLASGKTLTFSGNYQLNSAGTSRKLTIAGTGDTTISGILRESNQANGAIVVSSSGITTFSGNNTFSGPLTVNSGATLKGGNTNSLGFGGTQRGGNALGNTTVSSGGVLDLNGATGINEPIILNGTGISSSGALINNSATAASIGSGIAGITVAANTGSGSGVSSAPSITITGSGTGAAATASLGVTAASFTINGGTTVYSVAPTVTIGGGSGAVATAILTSGTVSGITVTNAGIGFSGTPTISFSGGTVTSAGTNPTGVGNAGNFTVSGIQMTSAGSGYTGTPTVSFSSGGGSATPILSSVTLASNSSIGGSGNITIDAVVAESGGSRALTKVGNGTLTLTAANTYTGATTINGGTLSIASITNGGVAGALGNSTNLAANLTLGGGTLEYTGSSNGSTDRNFTLSNGTNSTISVTSPNTTLAISGAAASTNGSLTKSGSGTLALSGNNTYTGATTISAGTLQIGSGSTTGTLSTYSAITNNGTLAFNRSDTITQGTDFNSVIGGTGALIQAGSGNLVLAGANTYTGATTISAGTLRIGSGSTTGSLSTSSAITNNGTLAFNRSDTITQGTDFNSVIGGTGALIQAGSGNLVLAGANTYTGATTISAGTLRIGSGSTTGSLSTSSAITNNGTLAFNRSDTITQGTDFNSVIGGTGALIQAGSGTLALSGANTYSGGTTLSVGTLALNSSSAIGSGNLTITGETIDNTSGSAITLATNNSQKWNGNFTFAGTNDLNLGTGSVSMNASRMITVNSANLTVGGAISGTGFGLTKSGNGTLVLAGANTYNGQTTLSSGTIIVTNKAALGTGSLALSGGTLQASTDLTGANALTTSGVSLGASSTVSGSNSITISGNSTGFLQQNLSITNNLVSGKLLTFTGNLGLKSNGSNRNLTIAGTGDTTFSGILSDGAVAYNGFTASSTGTTTLSGNNSYSGPTTVSAGTLVISGTNNSTGTITVSGGTLQLANTTANNGGIASGLLTLSGGMLQATSASPLTLSNAVLVSASSTVSGAQALTFNGSLTNSGGNRSLTNNMTNTLTLAGPIYLSENGTVGRTLTIAGTGNTIINGAIANFNGSGTAGGLAITNTGTVTFAGNNTYSGATTLTAGTLQLQNANAIQNSPLSLNGGTLQLRSDSNTTFASSGNITIGGSTTINVDRLTADGTGATLSLGALVIPTALNSTQRFTGGNNTLLSIASLALPGLGGQSTTLNATTTSVIITGNVTNGISTTSGNRWDSLYLDGTSVANVIQGVISDSTTAISGGGNATVGNGDTRITKQGTGTWTLAGNNTYVGPTVINAGILTASHANALGSTASGTTVSAAGAALQLTGGITFGTESLTLNGDGISSGGALRNISGFNTYQGAIALGSASRINTDSDSLTLSGNITGATQNLTVGGAGNTTISGVIGTTTGTLTKDGAGTLTLTGNNTYTGATTISTGNISINSTSALGSTSGVNLADATALLYTGGAATLNRTITVTSGTGTIRNTGAGLLTLSGSLAKNGTTLTFDTGSFNVSGVISGSSANSDLVVDAASVTLNNANTYNGPTRIIDGGTLTANVSNALPTANGRTAVTMDATGTGNSTLALGASQSIASLTGNTTSTVTLGSSTLTIGTTNGTTTTYAGRITGSDSSALVKDGASTQVLSGDNTAFIGTTTINSGTFAATSSNALGGTSQIIVNNSGSFLVTAENAVNDNANVTLAGGTLAVNGTFNENVGLLTLSANSTLDFSGFVGTLRFSGVGSWASGTNLAIWNWSGTPRYGDPVNNYQTPSNLVFSTVTSNLTDNLANISFYSDSGNSFVGNGFEVSGFSGGGSEIIAVPEPATLVYAIVLLAGSILQHIRCRSKRRSLKA